MLNMNWQDHTLAGKVNNIVGCLLHTDKPAKLQGATFGYPTLAECSGIYLIIQKTLEKTYS